MWPVEGLNILYACQIEKAINIPPAIPTTDVPGSKNISTSISKKPRITNNIIRVNDMITEFLLLNVLSTERRT